MALIFMAALLCTPAAHAQNNNAASAQALFDQGRQAMAEEKYEAACGYFDESNRLDPAVGTQFNLALCERKRGRVASSWALYRAVLQQLAPNDRRRPAAERAVAELEAVLPRLTISVTEGAPAEAKAYRNETELTQSMRGIALPVDPGVYVLRLEAPGHVPGEVSVEVALSENKSVTLELGEAEPAAVETSPALPAPSTAPAASADALPPVAEPASAAASAAPGRTEPSPAPTQGAPDSGDEESGTEQSDADLPRRKFNFSLFHPIGTKESDKHRVDIELGIFYSYVGALDGFGLTFGLLRTRRLDGVALAGAATVVEGPTNGVAISYMLNAGEGRFDGVRVAGLANIDASSDEEDGKSEGVHVAGVANISGEHFEGPQIAGVTNIVLDGHKGPLVTAVTNVVFGGLEGASVAALVNLADSVQGAQIGLSNVSLASVRGAQVGLLNVAGHVHGAQVGLINVANEVDGVSIGLLPISIRDGVQPTVWASTAYPLNVGLRFAAGVLATTLSASYEEVGGVPYVNPGISLGGRIPIADFYLDLDAGYRMELEGDLSDFRRHRYPYRLSVGWQPHPYFRSFVGGGVLYDVTPSIEDGEPDQEEFSPLGFVGVSVLR